MRWISNNHGRTYEVWADDFLVAEFANKEDAEAYADGGWNKAYDAYRERFDYTVRTLRVAEAELTKQRAALAWSFEWRRRWKEAAGYHRHMAKYWFDEAVEDEARLTAERDEARLEATGWHEDELASAAQIERLEAERAAAIARAEAAEQAREEARLELSHYEKRSASAYDAWEKDVNAYRAEAEELRRELTQHALSKANEQFRVEAAFWKGRAEKHERDLAEARRERDELAAVLKRQDEWNDKDEAHMAGLRAGERDLAASQARVATLEGALADAVEALQNLRDWDTVDDLDAALAKVRAALGVKP